MAHFAEIDSNNIVVRVIVVHDNDCLDDSGNESEAKGAKFCQNLLGGTWVQTSYNGKIRKNYAGVGFVYDAGRDAFIPTKLFDSWVLNEDTCQWQAPVPYPEDGATYRWDEATVSWVPVAQE